MAAILTNPYLRLKIPKSHQNVFQAIAVDLCRKADIKYTPEIRTYFNKLNNREFPTLKSLILNGLIKFPPFENWFEVSSVMIRDISEKQLITKARSMDANTSILGYTEFKEPVYITTVNDRPAVFGDISGGVTSVVIIRKPVADTNTVKTWTVYYNNVTHNIFLDQNKELNCNFHRDNCIGKKFIRSQKLKPGVYAFLDDSKLHSPPVPLATGPVSDDSLTDSDYEYEDYADPDDQIDFMYNLINNMIKPSVKYHPQYKSFLEKHKDEINAILENPISEQNTRKLADRIASLIEKDIDFNNTGNRKSQLSDPDSLFKLLATENFMPDQPEVDEARIDLMLGDIHKKHNLKCDIEELESAFKLRDWPAIIDLLCENYGSVDKVNAKIKRLLENSSIYMAIPTRVLDSFANTEVKTCYLTYNKPGGYLDVRIAVDILKHNADLSNILSFPKYGMIGTKDYPLYNTEITRGYGSIILEFKDVVKERSTLCLGDSLDYPISPVAMSFDDFTIYNFIGILVNYPSDNLDTILLERRIDDFMQVLENIMNPESLDYGLDMNFLMTHSYSYTGSYFEVQVKGDLMLSDRDIKAIFVTDSNDAIVVSNVLTEESLNIPMKYSKSFNYSQANKLIPLAEREGKNVEAEEF